MSTTKDAHGQELHDGDTICLIKDLKVKGSSLTLKRGTTAKNIRLTDNPDEIDVRIQKTALVLKAEFVKKM